MNGFSNQCCTYCGREFHSNHDLILHIEAMHICFDVDEERLESYLKKGDRHTTRRGLPMSLILPYGTPQEHERVRREELQRAADAKKENAKEEENKKK